MYQQILFSFCNKNYIPNPFLIDHKYTKLNLNFYGIPITITIFLLDDKDEKLDFLDDYFASRFYNNIIKKWIYIYSQTLPTYNSIPIFLSTHENLNTKEIKIKFIGRHGEYIELNSISLIFKN